MGIGDWGLGIGPNPQSPIPNPQSPIPILITNFIIIFLSNNKYISFNKNKNEQRNNKIRISF
jgi:hypothetical protein